MDDVALLRLQIEWGADEALDDEPVVRLREIVRQAPVLAPAPVRLVRPDAAPRGTPAERAVAAAAAAGTLEALRAAIMAFDGCPLRETAGNTVFIDGHEASDTLLISDPPGADEDRGGRPFAGKDGALLDKMLTSAGLDRTQVLMAPLIPWRPPGGRPPNPGELAVCLPFLHRLIALAGPRRILLFGALAARALLPAAPGRRRAVGWVDSPVPGLSAPVPMMALPGLGTLAKVPMGKREIWAGLRLLRRTLDADE